VASVTGVLGKKKGAGGQGAECRENKGGSEALLITEALGEITSEAIVAGDRRGFR